MTHPQRCAIDVLDHGEVRLVEVYGSDQRIVEAARMSTQKGFEGWGPRCAKCGSTDWVDHDGDPVPPKQFGSFVVGRKCGACGGFEAAGGDEKLLAYLWKNRHTTPFEMAGAVFEVQAPIFVFREWHRHRTQSYNEMSARYAPLPDVNYVPTVERLLAGGGHLTKQAGTVAGAAVLTPEGAEAFRRGLEKHYRRAEEEYQAALACGVAKELARVVLPVGRYSRMRASANLLNWTKFLTLRCDEHAQYEIRMYANAVAELLRENFPRTMVLFDAERAR